MIKLPFVRPAALVSWNLVGLLLLGGGGTSPGADDERLYVNDKKAPENLHDLRKIQESLQASLPQARKATVGIDLGGGAGSGVIVSEDGLVLTAAHVSGGVDKELTVILEDGTRVKATSLGLVSTTDCAMMQITEEGSYPYVEIDRDDRTRLGDWVYSLGHSGGFDKERGVVVRIGRLVRVTESTIQSDCNLIGGDSGGPLFDLNGRLIGIHSRVGASLEQNMHVPIREFLKNWDKMKEAEFVGEGPFAKKPEKGKAFLGVATEAREDGGVRVTKVGEDTAAAKAGLQVGDVILKVGADEVADKEGFSGLLFELFPGDKIELTVLRDGEEQTIEIEMAKR
jgi:serine protease Do